MNVINENMPRTMEHHKIAAKDKDRLDIANQIDEYFSKGGG